MVRQIKNFCLLFLVVLTSLCYANDISQWESKVDIPENVRKLSLIKNKRSIEYEITSYEAAMDLMHLAKSQFKVGNTIKSLHFISLAAKLFPYRDDIIEYFKVTLDSYTDETNNLISLKKIGCDELKERTVLLNRLSPKSVQRINREDVSCKINIEHSYKSINDIDISQWIKTDLPKNNDVKTEGISDSASDSLFYRAQREKIKNKEIDRLSNKVYKLKFPKLEIILSSFKVLGNLSLDTVPNIKTDKKGNTYLQSSFIITTDAENYGIDSHCRAIKKFFTLPPEINYGTYNFFGKSKCGLSEDGSYRPGLAKTVYSDWGFSPLEIPMMKEGLKYTGDKKNGKTPLYHFFPRTLDMYVQYNYKHKSFKRKSFKFKIDSLTGFFYWFNLGNLREIDAPKIIENNANISINAQNILSIPVADINTLKGISSIEVKFDSQKTFKRLVKELDVRKM